MNSFTWRQRFLSIQLAPLSTAGLEDVLTLSSLYPLWSRLAMAVVVFNVGWLLQLLLQCPTFIDGICSWGHRDCHFEGFSFFERSEWSLLGQSSPRSPTDSRALVMSKKFWCFPANFPDFPVETAINNTKNRFMVCFFWPSHHSHDQS